MKKTRRFASLATAAILAACAVVPATMSALPVSAATAGKVTFVKNGSDDTATHTYKAYQIFSGEVDAEGTLTNVQWANTANGAAFLTALKGSAIGSSFTDCETAAAVAAVLGKEQKDSELLQNFATFAASQKANLKEVNAVAAESIPVTEDGYYLFEDVSTIPTDKTGAKTRYLIAQIDAEKGLDITVKSSLPSVEKKIKENTKNVAYGAEANETEEYVGAGYNDVADYNIGDAVPFKLIGTLPSRLDDYKTYKYTFHDTLGKEFTAPAQGDIKVSCKTGDTVTDITNKATITVTAATATEGAKINVEFTDIKTAGATKDSIITVEYNAVLSSGAVIGLDGQTNEVYLEYSNNPNAGGEGETGNTPVDKVIAFTYELDVNKVDATTKVALKGAKFKLQAADGDHAKQWAVLAATNEAGKYKIDKWVDTEADATEFENATGNTFAVIGLDSGKYNLKETAAPSGYNTPGAPFVVDLTATTVNNQDWDSFKADEALTELNVKLDNADGTADVTTGKGEVTVGNSSGSTLPSTGGIGTTIFYVAGGVLVVGAGVLLITKKRAKDAQ